MGTLHYRHRLILHLRRQHFDRRSQPGYFTHLCPQQTVLDAQGGVLGFQFGDPGFGREGGHASMLHLPGKSV